MAYISEREHLRLELSLRDDGPAAFDKFFLYLRAESIKKKGDLMMTKWHLTTVLNSFNTYYCYDIHPTHEREISPIFIKDNGRLMGIELVGDLSGGPDTFVFYFDFVEKDGTSTVNPVFLPKLEELYDKNNKQFKFDEPVTYTHDSLDKGSRYSIVYRTNDKNRGAPPLRMDITNEFEWHVNLKYVSPGRIIQLKKESVTAQIPSLPTEGDIYHFMLRSLFGSTLAFIHMNMRPFYKIRSVLKGPPRTVKVPFLLYQYDRNEKNLLEKAPIYEMSAYETEIQEETKKNDVTIRKLATGTAEIMKRLNDIVPSDNNNNIPNITHFFSLGDTINEPYTTKAIEDAEANVKSQLIEIKKYNDFLDQMTERLQTLIELITGVREEDEDSDYKEEEEEEESDGEYDKLFINLM